MKDLKTIAAAVLFWTGVLSLGLVVSRTILVMVYELPYWLPGVMVTTAYGVSAAGIGMRALQLSWKQLLLNVMAWSGLGFAFSPARSFGISELDAADWSVTLLGATIVIAGIVLLWRLRGADPHENTQDDSAA